MDKQELQKTTLKKIEVMQAYWEVECDKYIYHEYFVRTVMHERVK